MTATISQSDDGNILEVEVTGTLTRQDYDVFVPVIESQMQNGKVKLLVSMREFTGWELGALWEDIKFDLKHFGDIERLALVGDKKWEEGMAWFCKPFTSATIAYFDRSQIEAARSWIREA